MRGVDEEEEEHTGNVMSIVLGREKKGDSKRRMHSIILFGERSVCMLHK